MNDKLVKHLDNSFFYGQNLWSTWRQCFILPVSVVGSPYYSKRQIRLANLELWICCFFLFTWLWRCKDMSRICSLKVRFTTFLSVDVKKSVCYMWAIGDKIWIKKIGLVSGCFRSLCWPLKKTSFYKVTTFTAMTLFLPQWDKNTRLARNKTWKTCLHRKKTDFGHFINHCGQVDK